MTDKETFQDKIKRWAREVYLFFSSFVFWKNFMGMIAFFLVLFFMSSWWMRCYTNHGESLQVHDYVGLDLEDAVRKAKSRSFSIVVSDSIFIPGKAPNMVISQNPAPLSRVKENRKIYLRVTKSVADMVTLPKLFDGSDDFNSYETKLLQIGVNAEIIGRRYDSKLEENTILEVVYLEDTITNKLDNKYQVPKGAVVGFIVTERGGGRVPIPNLVCQKYDAVRFVIGNYNLNIGSVIEDASVTHTKTAYIWKQVPRYSTSGTMGVGEQIDIYLTQYRPDNCGEDEFNIEDLEDEDLNEQPASSFPEDGSSTSDEEEDFDGR